MDNNHTKTPFQQWNEIVNATSQKDALVQHFTYLADSPNYLKLLEIIMEHKDTVSIEGDCLKVTFQNGKVLSGEVPEENIPKHYPLSFQEKQRHHKFLGIDEYQVILGDQQLFCESDGWFEEMDEWRNICNLDEVLSPLTVGPDLWLYHPTETNASGAPMLYFKAHDGGDVEKPRDVNIGSLFLEQIAELLDIDVNEVLHPVNEDELNLWWQKLDAAWKTFFGAEPKSKQPSTAYLKQLWKETKLHLSKDSGITTLEPIRELKELDRIWIDALPITDFSPLQDLKKLSDLSIVNIPFGDFDTLERLPALDALRLTNTGFEDLRKIRSHKKLTSLILNNNPIDTLEGIEHFPRLIRLEIDDTKVTAIGPMVALKKLNYLHICRLKPIDYHLLTTMNELLTIEVDECNLGDFNALTQGISLEKYLNFLSKVSGTNAQGIKFPTSQDILCSGEAFITHLQAINFDANEYADTLCMFANRLLIKALRDKNKSLSNGLIAEMLQLKLDISKDIKQMWLGNVIVAACIEPYDAEIDQEILKSVNADKITDARLAFNVACFYALRKQKPQMLASIKLALNLGKTKQDFVKEENFKYYLNDPDFIKQLK